MITVVTNGCFDCLHAGHVHMLAFARSQGDQLIVAVNSDDSVRRLKGDSRPINCAEDRVAVLKACRHVDKVVLFNEDTPAELYSLLRPDVLVKGGDYAGQKLAGSEFCGKVVLAPKFVSNSTTTIAEKIKELE